jgi:hypothetical protein
MWMLELLGEVGGDIKANIVDYLLLTSLGRLKNRNGLSWQIPIL